LCGVFALISLDFISLCISGRASLVGVRANWLRRSSRRILRFLRVKANYFGEPPGGGVLVCNHVSYLDVLVLGQKQPLVFVSKSEVRDWPVIGWLTRCAGTLFIRRENKGDVVRLAEQFRPLVEQGTAIVIFPEGTSSDGRQVLPFRSSLLEPAARYGWPVSPVWIGYSFEEGSVEREICYWGDMSFAPHLFNLLCKRGIQAHVYYRTPLAPGLDRKQMAKALHQEITRLRAVFVQGSELPARPGVTAESRNLPVPKGSSCPKGVGPHY